MDPNVIEGFFNLVAQAVSNRKANIAVELPTIDDLRTELNASEAIPAEGTPANGETPVSVDPEKATDIATGCVPCSIGHLGTCSGLLNEAMRFARKDGIESGEVIERVNMCMDELNSLERVDLRPEMIVNLPEWEKTLAEKALNLSRTLRHNLEQLSNVSTLEKVSAETQATRQEIGKGWFQGRLSRMTPEQRKGVEDKLQETLSLEEAKKVAAKEAVQEIEKAWNSQEKK
jgi:hypothetical protein